MTVGANDLSNVASQIAFEITSRCVAAGIAEVEQRIIADFIVIVAQSLPEEVAKRITLNPRGVIGWTARIADKELARDIAKIDPVGFALGVASEALVEFVRSEAPHSTILQNLGVEALTFSIRETTVAYAAARGGIQAAIAAQSIVSGTTLFEASQAVYDVTYARLTESDRKSVV